MTLLLSYLFGIFGADRFYLGKTKSAIVKLLTFGGFGYWWVIDLFLTLFGGQRDVWGLRLEGYDRYKKTVWKAIGAVLGGSLVLGMIAAITISAFDSTGPTTFGWILIGVLSASAIIAVLILFMRRRETHPGDEYTHPKLVNAAQESDPVSAPIRGHVEKLLALRQSYFQKMEGSQLAREIVEQIDQIVTNVVELFQRLESKAGYPQQRQALAEYDETLGKLVDALGRDYGLDLLDNPRFWDDPERRLAYIHSTMHAVDSQLVDNIKQINARQRLIFDDSVNRMLDPRALGG